LGLRAWAKRGRLRQPSLIFLNPRNKRSYNLPVLRATFTRDD
jgi:hypothetical protein